MQRLLILAAGVVLMITGCNGLLSGSFGTQKLRTLSVADASDGVGDADYVRFTKGELLTDLCRTNRDERYPPVTACPLVTTAAGLKIREGSPVRYPVVVWWEGDMSIPSESTFEGFISQLPLAMDLDWAHEGLSPGEKLAYLHLGEQPTPWYWHLALVAGGLILALGSEARSFRKRASTVDRQT